MDLRCECPTAKQSGTTAKHERQVRRQVSLSKVIRKITNFLIFMGSLWLLWQVSSYL
jgi:hypothetical protein